MSTTKRVTIRQSDLKPESDKAKKIYRFAVEVVRRLDEILKQPKAQKDVFLPDAIQLRSRLQEHCEKLLFYGPLEYGRKAEEMLWRKVYYDVIQLMKHNKRQMRPNKMLNSAFQTHLSSAQGYYHHLLFRLQHEYSLQLDGVVDFCFIPEHRSHLKQNHHKKLEPDGEVKEWALGACHRCLIYLGDIARYQNEYNSCGSSMLAQRYYHQAICLVPDVGMPHNQLGTLAGGRQYNLSAIYHYIRCLCCPTTFAGAQNNIKRLFEKNRKRYQELSQTSPRDLTPDQQRVKDIKKFVVRFINLLEAFMNKEKSDDSTPIQELCQSTLQDLNLCMFYQPPHVTNPSLSEHDLHVNTDDKITYLDDEALFKIIIICIGTVHLLQMNNSRQLAAAIAFSLALFSHIINHAVIRLQSALYELESPRKVLEVESGEEKKNESDTEDESDVSDQRRQRQKAAENGQSRDDDKKNTSASTGGQKGDKKPAKMRRARRRRRDTDGNSSDSGSDLSEGEAGADGLMVSDDETHLDFLNNSLSSNSDSEDHLMVSQEMRPGSFLELGLRNTLLAEPELHSVQEDTADVTLESPRSADALTGITHSSSSNNTSPRSSTSASQTSNQNASSSSTLFPLPAITPDVSDYLRDFPTEWLADSSQFLSQTLQWAGLLSGTGGLSQYDSLNDPNINAVMQGKKEVRAPPGFETSVESRHVMEISEKLANFNIDTDTDGNISTDVENSTIATESELDTETEGEADSVIEKGDQQQKHLQRLLQLMTNEGLLMAIKVYCDWIRCNPHIITTCAKSSQSLWTRLSVLLNFLPQLAELDRIEYCRTVECHQMLRAALASDWQQHHPLQEDIHVHKFPPLIEAQKSQTYDTNRRLELTFQQEAILRLCSLRHFGYFVAKLKGVSFTFNASTGQFIGPQQPVQSASTPTAPNAVATDEVRRNQLMRDMAQLRLQAEVSQLEGSLQASKGHVSLPPYIVSDASSLCEHLALIRQLVASARFILIIPIVVIDHLDMLKKDSANAREVIRWLETELKRGNRYLRVQKNHEKGSADKHKNLKKRDLTAWRLGQIVDCAYYLCQQTPDCDSRSMVSVLSVAAAVSAAANISLPLKQMLALAHQQGIVVEDAVQFHSKWKDTCKTKKT